MSTQISAQNEFACELLAILSKQNNDSNVFFCPVSISLCLSMALLGAKNRTRDQMISALKLDNVSNESLAEGQSQLMENFSEGGSITLANQIFVKPNLEMLETYRELVTHWYQVTPTQFKSDPKDSAQMINSWVSEVTHGKISSLLQPSDFTPLTAMILVNAVHFKSNWNKKFNPEDTKAMPFYLNKSKQTKVNMMFQKNRYRFSSNKDLGLDYLEIGYLDQNIKMVIVLPQEKTGLDRILPLLTPALLKELGEAACERVVHLWLPAFKIEESYALNDVLAKDMGMPDAFSAVSADFGDMDVSGDLYISKVVHKAAVEVNEEGTEATAATAVIMKSRCMHIPDHIEFKVDRPSFFAIVASPDRVVFLGLLRQPPSL